MSVASVRLLFVEEALNLNIPKAEVVDTTPFTLVLSIDPDAVNVFEFMAVDVASIPFTSDDKIFPLEVNVLTVPDESSAAIEVLATTPFTAVVSTPSERLIEFEFIIFADADIPFTTLVIVFVADNTLFV